MVHLDIVSKVRIYHLIELLLLIKQEEFGIQKTVTMMVFMKIAKGKMFVVLEDALKKCT